jgi:3-methyladenine DNA glycosylase/8-oxoguanine DNA glycosylase
MATLLETDAVLKRGLDELARADPVMRGLAAEGIVPVLRKRPPGFEGLAWIVVGQQVSTASAAAIWGRLRQILEPVAPDAFLRLPTRTCAPPGSRPERSGPSGPPPGRSSTAGFPSTLCTNFRPTRPMAFSRR